MPFIDCINAHLLSVGFLEIRLSYIIFKIRIISIYEKALGKCFLRNGDNIFVQFQLWRTDKYMTKNEEQRKNSR